MCNGKFWLTENFHCITNLTPELRQENIYARRKKENKKTLELFDLREFLSLPSLSYKNDIRFNEKCESMSEAIKYYMKDYQTRYDLHCLKNERTKRKEKDKL